ncbi:RNA-binding cell elongation regulator Jag/EloR [Rhabdothermincola sediminis]|uniref:RNA-binding cell elongation regulator Jag/EloR n=1 Tax=Rhabdothermincola sediminis TaxID=2751370 RepID=UPI001AA06BB3|nr:RNA-binding cell elongation regulator Jag/EloR [Rhabdothermincola sediminis]
METTGRTVDEAKDRALDQLGVDLSDAEFEVIEEPKAGLFGRIRREARVRARVKPTQPRPKTDRRERRRRGRSAGDKGREEVSAGSPKTVKRQEAGQTGTRTGEERPTEASGAASVQSSEAAGNRAAATSARRSRRRGGGGRGASGRGADAGAVPSEQAAKSSSPDEGGPGMTVEEVSLEEQGDIVEAFLEGLLDAFDLDGDVQQVRIDDDTLEVRIEGDDLGLLIGPKGQTLVALQELARTVVQRQAQGAHRGRFRVDVAGYRERRRQALERFARSVAEEVKRTGVQKALEPMGSADRKVVHDTVNAIDGVSTLSEGEDPRRRVIIVPQP